MVALKRTGDNGSVALDVRWDTCRRVAELIVQQYQRRRQQSSIDGCSLAVQLKVVTPIAAMASDVQSAGSTTAMDPNKVLRVSAYRWWWGGGRGSFSKTIQIYKIYY